MKKILMDLVRKIFDFHAWVKKCHFVHFNVRHPVCRESRDTLTQNYELGFLVHYLTVLSFKNHYDSKCMLLPRRESSQLGSKPRYFSICTVFSERNAKI